VWHRNKQEAWIRWKKSAIDNPVAWTEYHWLKSLTWRASRKAQNAWWADRVEKLEEKYEMAVKSGRGGSLLKDLKVMQMSQRPKTNSVLKADNGQDRIVRTEDKLEWWRRHFESATYVRMYQLKSQDTSGLPAWSG